MTCHHWEGLGSFRDEFPVSEDDVGGDGTAHDGDLKEGVAKGPPGADADIQDGDWPGGDIRRERRLQPYSLRD